MQRIKTTENKSESDNNNNPDLHLDGYPVYSIPIEYRGVGFLIARFTLPRIIKRPYVSEMFKKLDNDILNESAK